MTEPRVESAYSPGQVTARRKPAPQGISPLTIWALRLLAILGLGVSGFLAWSSLAVGDIAGCAANGVWDCSHVLHSPWAKWLGIPVSVPALAVYASLLASLLFVGSRVPGPVQRLAWSIASLCIFSAGLCAVWFVSLQVFQLGKLCKYCMIAHSVALVLVGLLLWIKPLAARQASRLAGFAAAGVAILVVGQVFGPQPKTYEVDVHDLAVEADGNAETIDSVLVGEDEDFVDFAAPDEDVEAPTENKADEISFRGDSPGTSDQEVADLVYMTGVRTDKPKAPKSEPKVVPQQPARGGIPASTSSWNPHRKAHVLLVSCPIPSTTPTPQTETDSTPPMDRPAPSRPTRMISYPGAKAKLNIYQWPLLGSADAKHVMIELFDYTCGHCRRMNRYLQQARQRFGDQLAIVVLPVPLNAECNDAVRETDPSHKDACEIARIALSVWRLRPDAFPEFHDWLCDTESGRTVLEARARAESLVEPKLLREHLSGSLVGKFISKHVALYKRAGEGVLPRLFTERITVKGELNSADELYRVLEQSHGLAAVN